MDQDATRHGARPRPRRLCVRWGPRSPPQKGGGIPEFSARLFWPNGWTDQDGTWHRERPQPRRLFVIWRPSPSSKRERRLLPQFSAHVYFGQTAGCIKMPLGMEVGLSPGDFVLDGQPARLLNFRPMFIIVIVISLEHCTVVIGLFKFKFKF